MGKMTSDFVLRAACRPDDDGIILDPWRRHIRSRFPLKLCNIESFNIHHRDIVMESILDRCTPVIMAAQDDPTFVYGWIIGERQGFSRVIHFAYVKESFRRRGVFTELLNTCLPLEFGRKLYYTHRTGMSDVISRSFDAVYNPYRIMWSRNG